MSIVYSDLVWTLEVSSGICILFSGPLQMSYRLVMFKQTIAPKLVRLHKLEPSGETWHSVAEWQVLVRETVKSRLSYDEI